MSVQFRTSQKDLITKINKSTSTELGVCCQYAFATGFTKTLKTPLDCYLNSGTFSYGDLDTVVCEHSGGSLDTILGCCCSCSFAKEDPNYETLISQMMPIDSYCTGTTVPAVSRNSFGLKKVTQCECERIGGKFTAGECPTELSTDASVRQYCYERRAIEPPPPAPGTGQQNAPCGTNTARGGSGITHNSYNFKAYGSGAVDVSYDMYFIQDSMDIYYPRPINGATYSDATIVASTNGLVSGQGTLSFYYTPDVPPDSSGYTATYEEFVVKVNGMPNSATAWTYDVSCPSNAAQSLVSLLGISCDVDVRLPRSCCYFEYDINGFPVGLSCENVCTQRECELKAISTQLSAYSLGTVCPPNVLSRAITPGGAYECSSLASIMASGSNLFKDISYGSCYRIVDNGANGYSYDCEITAEFFCHDGYWVPINDANQLCSEHPYQPQVPVKSARKVEPESMSETAFDALDIAIGEFYKGGYYVGKFQPGSPLSPSGSNLYGSKEFSYASNIVSDASGNGDRNKKWALFIENASFVTSLFTSDEPNTLNYEKLSSYDGFYNCYGNFSTFSGIKSKTTNTIVGKDRKGFVDFYIPSINELMFIANQVLNNRYLATTLNLSGTYLSSSSYNDFIYTQYLSGNPLLNNLEQDTSYGRILLAKSTTPVSCRFVRRILLT